MEKEVIIICLVYIERLIINSGFNLVPINWRRIVFVALILASKVFFHLLKYFIVLKKTKLDMGR